MKSAILESHRYGRPFARLYLNDRAGRQDLTQAAKDFDYVFAYSREDLGLVDGFTRDQKWAQVINLDGPSEQVFSKLGKRARQEIRKTYRDSDLAIVVDDTARNAAYEFYCAIKVVDGATPDIEEDFDSVRWINCYHNGELVSVNSVYDNGTVLRGKHMSSIRNLAGVDTAFVGRVNRRLLWEVCELGLNESRVEFDMGGLDFADPAKRGITEFKQRFGGSTMPIYVYRYTSGNWPPVVARSLKEGRSIL